MVGGGVLGLMHARRARQLGLAVTQLERDLAPRRASVRNFGLVWVSGRAAGEELGHALRARELWEEVAAEAPAVGFRPAGSLTVALDEAELAVLAAAAGGADAEARGFELLGPEAARRRNPALRGPLLGALSCERDAVVEPRSVPGALRDHLLASGRYQYLAGRTAVEAGPGHVVDHLGQRHRADLVLLCTGDRYDGPGAAVLGERGGLRRCRLQMLQTAPLGERLPTALADGDSLRYYPAFRGLTGGLPDQAPVAAAHHAQLLVVQRATGELTVGDTHAYEEPFDFALDEAPYAHLVERAERLLGRPLPPVRRRWAGVYSQVVDDRLCHLATLAPGVVVVTGAGGRGMTLAPALAELTFEQLGAAAGATAIGEGR